MLLDRTRPRKALIGLLLLFILTIPLYIFANAVQGNVKARPLFAPDIVKVQLTPEAIRLTNLPQGLYAETAKFGLAEIDRIMAQFGGTKVLRAHIRLKDKAWEQENGVDRWFLVKVSKSTNIKEAAQAFKLSQYIETATPEYYAYTQAIPNDTYYPNNWGHNNTAQLPVYSGSSHSGAGVGTIGFDSNAQAAWDDIQGYGNASIIIAIIDTGVDTTHPDLRLVTGYDYGDNDSNPMDNSADPGHGTACSGVAAGRGNNALGIAGMAGGCSVMPLKIAAADGSLGFTAIENALYHTGDNNVDVASMSFGAVMGVGESPSTDNAVAYAYNHGVVLLAASGNYSSAEPTQNVINYPSNHPAVISVCAASPSAQRKSYTSSDGESWWGAIYGDNIQDGSTSVDITAPTILPTTDIISGGYVVGNYYMWFNGTSCATPYAAGVAGLLLSKNPNLTPAQVRTAITSTATDMTIDGGVGWDRYTGYGMINAQGALASLIPGMPVCTITAPLFGTIFNQGDLVTVNVTATDSATRSISRVDFYLDGSVTPISTVSSAPYSWVWNTAGASRGNHTIVVSAVDNTNITTSDQVTIMVLVPADEGFETGNFSALPWMQSGNLPWTAQTAVKYLGSFAAQSGTITHSQTSTMAVTLNITTGGDINFFMKTSSEVNYDYLRFYIDNVQQGQWSGEVAWTLQTYAVTAGMREFKWTYAKDTSVSSGSDCAYIDEVVLPPYTIIQPPTISWSPASITQTQDTNQTAAQNLLIGNTGNLTLDYSCSLPTGLSTVLDETFATTTIPTGWTQVNVIGTTNWAFTIGGHSSYPATAYDGTYNALLYKGSTTSATTKLITPSLNLAGANAATLTFWHAQKVWAGGQDTLRVYYRTTAAGTWTLLNTYSSSITAWTQRTINLPNLTGTYYIGFQGITDYGYGICLDKVVVTKQSSTATWLSLNDGNTVSGSIIGGSNSTISVGFNTTGMSIGTYNSTITVTSNSTTNSSISIPVSLVIANPSPPSIPLNVIIIANLTTGDVTISWDASTGNPTGYKIYRSLSPVFIPAEPLLIGTNSAGETSIIVPSAAAPSSAFFRVISFRN